ncbi:MAG: aminoacyl-tRNA hydrolase [Deltaproteobacteria bacterium]|nr:aminoacyl-tRNA hydrolase [Deltaproteobacteria bacterium]MBI2975304.1 aminoacyl-tRNA hydrolase [Deltaproteobacteria bacterium]
MKLLVGLGNPGRKYAKTRHNIGFAIIDAFVEKIGGFKFKEDFDSFFAISEIDNEKVCIAKPQTFMNLSGNSVAAIASFYKIAGVDITVVHDDIDMPLGKIKIVKGAGTGGHNGVDSIISNLGTKDFWRLKVGIGRPPEGFDPADYVLGGFNEDERKLVEKIICTGADVVRKIFESGHNAAMQKYNNSLVSI